MDFSGRIDRRRYIVAQLVLLPLGSVFGALFTLATSNLTQTFSKDSVPEIVRGIVLSQFTARALLVVAIPAILALLVANISFTARRLHDLGFSGWFMLLWVVFELFWSGLSTDSHSSASSIGAFEAVLMMVPGQPEANLYGANPHALAETAPAARPTGS